MRSLVLVAAVFAASFAAPVALVAAQNGDEPSDADLVRARERFHAGMAAAQGERWDEAREAFQEAYDLSRRAPILINIATAQAQSGLLVDAYRTYQCLLRISTVEAAHRAAAEGAMRTIEPQIGLLRMSLRGLDAEDVVRLDGETVAHELLAEPLPVSVGAHRATITRGRQALEDYAFEVRAGSSAEALLALPARAASAALATPEFEPVSPVVVSSPGAPPPDSRDEQPFVGSTWFWVALGVAGAAVASGVLFAVNRSEEPGGYSGTLPPGHWTVNGN